MLTPGEIAQLVGAGIAAAQAAGQPERGTLVHTSRLKMENPEKFDGKSSSTFNQWWESVTMYLGFYPETVDRQKIAWVGTLLFDTALVWHLHRYHELGENNTWVNYAAAIRTEYRNEREAADAQLKLGQLIYQGSIRAYLTEFRALNNFARATGEALREKVDLAMLDAVLDIRFAHYLEDFADDEGFLQATHQAGLQVEKKKALRTAKEAMRAGPAPAKKEERKKEEKQPTTRTESRETRKNDSRAPKNNGWESTGATLRGVPQNEIDVCKKIKDGCWQCGRMGHRTFDCFSFQTTQGTELPPAPWKVGGVANTRNTSEGKRKTEEDPIDTPAAKLQKVAAVEEIFMDQPLWVDTDDSDF